MATLKTTVRCSYPNWCSKCGVLHVSTIEEVEIDFSNCSRFYDNPFPFEIRHSQGVLREGRRCCEGTLTVYYNASKKIDPRELLIVTEAENQTTPPVENETFPTNSYRPYLPTIVSTGAGLGGLFLFIVCAVLILIWRRASQKVKSCKYKVSKSHPFDTIQNDYHPPDSHYVNTVNHDIINMNHLNRAPGANLMFLELQNSVQRQIEFSHPAPRAHIFASSSDLGISTDEPDYVNTDYVNIDHINTDHVNTDHVNTEGYLELQDLHPPPCRGAIARCQVPSKLLQKGQQGRYQSDIADNSRPHSYVEVIK